MLTESNSNSQTRTPIPEPGQYVHAEARYMTLSFEVPIPEEKLNDNLIQGPERSSLKYLKVRDIITFNDNGSVLDDYVKSNCPDIKKITIRLSLSEEPSHEKQTLQIHNILSHLLGPLCDKHECSFSIQVDHLPDGHGSKDGSAELDAKQVIVKVFRDMAEERGYIPELSD